MAKPDLSFKQWTGYLSSVGKLAPFPKDLKVTTQYILYYNINRIFVDYVIYQIKYLNKILVWPNPRGSDTIRRNVCN